MKRDLPFTMTEYESRIDKVRAQMSERGLDVLLLLSPDSINYLTGSLNRGPQYLTLPREGEPTILAWRFELPLVLYTSWLEEGAGFDTGEDQFQALRDLLVQQGLLKGTIGVEKDSHHVSAQAVGELTNALEGVRVVDGSGIVKSLLRIKSPQEIAYIKEAGKITARAMGATVDAARAGATDNEVAAAAHQAAVTAGSDPMNPPIVTTGFRSGFPHTNHLRHTIKPGDPVCLEMSGTYHRYHAPLMRTVFVGEPPDGAKEWADAALAALEVVLATCKPGVVAEDVAAAASKKLPLDDPEIVFHYTYGYSIGLGFPRGWADDPALRLIKGYKFTLEPGMVFHSTMSPRRKGKYGIFVSETFAITEDGCELMVDFPRRFFYK
jgi:Xaa-Pro dipeptidase